MQLWAIWTRSQCRISVTQVSVKDHGPLVCRHVKRRWSLGYMFVVVRIEKVCSPCQ